MEGMKETPYDKHRLDRDGVGNGIISMVSRFSGGDIILEPLPIRGSK
jgi:hypothetical protein